MAFTHGRLAKFYLVDSGSTERDLSAYITDVSLPKGADTAEVTALGDAAKNYLAGLKDSTLSFNGTRDATAEGYIDGVVGALTTWSYCPEGSASGKIKYSGTCIVTNYEPNSSVGDATKFQASGQVSGTITRTTL